MISINKQNYFINNGEFERVNRIEYCNLNILKDVGVFERCISLLREIGKKLYIKKILFVNPTHGGFIFINSFKNFDVSKVFYSPRGLQSSRPIGGESEENIIKNSVLHGIYDAAGEDYKIQNIEEYVNDISYSGVIIFSQHPFNWNLYNIKFDKTIIISPPLEAASGSDLGQAAAPFGGDAVHLEEARSFAEQRAPVLQSESGEGGGVYKNIFSLEDTEYKVRIPEQFNNLFIEKFKYYIKDSSAGLRVLCYDNLIHLCIMVKNGGEQFENTLIEALPYIDRWSILDTGSTDDTIEIINKILVGKVKGKLLKEPFINFRDSRNRLLEFAGKKCKYTLMLDDTYVMAGNLRMFLNDVRGDQISDSFSLFIKSDDSEYGSNRIVKTSTNLKYKYKIHEVIPSKNNYNVIIPIDKASILDKRIDYMHKRTIDRKQLDIKFLLEELEEDPDDPRSLYYLAQTYSCLEDYKTALFYFLKRIDHPNEGFIQEKIDAAFEAARICNFKLKRNWPECEKLYNLAYELDNSRPESLYFIGIHHHLNGDNKNAFLYFKKAFEIGYPSHCQYSLKPTLSFYFLPLFFVPLCYMFKEYKMGEDASKLFLTHNDPSDIEYNNMESWNKIFIKLNTISSVDVKKFVIEKKQPILCFLIDNKKKCNILTKDSGYKKYIVDMALYIKKNSNYKVVVFCNCYQNEILEGVEFNKLEYYFDVICNINIDKCIILKSSEYYAATLLGKVNEIYILFNKLLSGNVIPDNISLKKIFSFNEVNSNALKTRFEILSNKIYFVDREAASAKSGDRDSNKYFLDVIDFY